MSHRRRRSFVPGISRALLALLVTIVAGCQNPFLPQADDGGQSGDSGADAGAGGVPSCEFSACGGDLVGTWSMRRACATLPAGQKIRTTFCGDVPVTAVRIEGSNTTAFRVDGAYEVAGSLMAITVVTLPTECVSNRASCAAVAAELGSEFSAYTVTCSGTPTAGGCTCEVANSPASVSTVGSFTTSGDELVMTPASGSPLAYDYCVEGATLKVRERNPNFNGLQTVAVYAR